jgi:phage terminase large subunit
VGGAVKIIVSASFQPLLEDRKRYLILCGGRGSGKSEFTARKLFVRCMTEGDHRFLVVRKVRKTCKDSVVKVFVALLEEQGVPYDLNRTDLTLTITNPAGQRSEILFDGLDEPQKLKSKKGITGIWIEEATELTATDFTELDLILREPGPLYHQIIATFNPDEAQAPWLKARFFDHLDPDATVHVSTVEDNPIREVRERYLARLDLLQDATLRSIYRNGVWAAPKGQIYNWDVVPLPVMAFDDVWFGGDFGYTVDPAAVVVIRRRANEYWLQEMIYETGLTNQALGARIKAAGLGDMLGYFDSAEPKSIDELRIMGLNIQPADKGPDSVRAGIDFIKGQIVHIVEGSENIIRERGRYKWREDKSGNNLAEPVSFDDHACDAIRYGIFSHCARRPVIGYEEHY